jgi:hypothetical protein
MVATVQDVMDPLHTAVDSSYSVCDVGFQEVLSGMIDPLLLLAGWLCAATPAIAQNPAVHPVPKPDKIVTREQWGSTPDPIPDTRKHTPKYITIHHAGVLWTNSVDPAQFVRNMQAWGKKRPQLEKPPRDTYWPDLPYHFLVAPDGKIYEGRPVEYEPESNTEYSLAGNIGVEMMGDFNRQRPARRS